MARNGKYVVHEAKPSSTSDEAYEDDQFFVGRPEKKNPLYYLYNMLASREGNCTQTNAPKSVYDQMNSTTTWRERLAMLLMQTLCYLRSPLAKLGHVVETTGNIIISNGGVIATLLRFLYSSLFLFKKDTLVVPAQDSADYKSIIAMVDPRKDLLVVDASEELNSAAYDHRSTKKSNDIFPGTSNGDKRIADVMIMAAKFAYENEAVIKDVVTNSWKMHFVGSYNCWNEYQQRFNRQVFIFMDKEENANAIVIAWRGTAAFNAEDWTTDIDFSWFNLQGDAGKVHVGFLECLGLGDRHDMNTFSNLRKKKEKRNDLSREFKHPPPPTEPASGLSQDIIDAPEKILAYDDITKVVKGLLETNPNAKIFITGHSLGGALSVLYSGMLYYFGEKFVTDRIKAVYTFGQPRVGDQEFCKFMLKNLMIERYFRVVYANDIVPRLPFDDSLFAFKHWGLCYYFSSFYAVTTLKEEPNLNYFNPNILSFVSIHTNAFYELTNSLLISNEHGSSYKESLFSFLYRVAALFLPGIGDHSPVNYCNSVRLGNPMPLVAKLD